MTSNDVENSEIRLQVKAHVVNYLKVSPPNVYIRKSGDMIQDAVAAISTDRAIPLALEVVSFNIPQKVAYRIEEIKKGKEFKVTFSQIQESDEAYSGLLILKTNYTDRPTLKILVRTRFE